MLCKAKDAAIDGKSMNRVIQLKREINDLLSKEEKCGDKDHVPYGCMKVMVIQYSFIVELLIDFGVIELKCQKINWGKMCGRRGNSNHNN